MNGFTKSAELALQYASEGKSTLAIHHAQESLKLYPCNLALISSLADKLHQKDPNNNYLIELEDMIKWALGEIGKPKDVFHLNTAICALRGKLIRERIIYESKKTSIEGAINYQIKEDAPITRSCNSNKPANTIKSNIAVLSCIWQRPRLTAIFLDHLNRLRNELSESVTITPVIIGSEGAHSKKASEARGFEYHEFTNRPLSRKWDFGISTLKHHEIDGVVILGSDDLVNKNLFIHYAKLLKSGIQIAGLIDAFFLNLDSKEDELIRWKGYGGAANELGQPHRMGETIGMARLLSSDLLKEIGYSLWPGIEANESLDKLALNRLNSLGYISIGKAQFEDKRHYQCGKLKGQLGIRMGEAEIFAVDVKHGGTNITDITNYKKCPVAVDVIGDTWKCIEERLGRETANELNYLRS